MPVVVEPYSSSSPGGLLLPPPPFLRPFGSKRHPSGCRAAACVVGTAYSSSSPGVPPPPPASPPVVGSCVPSVASGESERSSSVTVFSSVSSSVVHDSCAPRMAAAARLCRLLPTGRKNVVACLVVHFRLHVLEAQVLSVGVPATIHRRIQLTQDTQVRSALPLATEGTQER